MFKIFKYLQPAEWVFFTLGMFFIFAQVWLDLKLPDYMAVITKLVQTPGSEMADVLITGAYMLFCALGSLAAVIAVSYIAAKIAASFSERLRSLMFEKVHMFSMEEVAFFSTSSLIIRSTNDVTQVTMFITMGLQMVLKAPVMGIWAVSKIIGKGYEWTLVTFAAVMITAILAIVTLFVVIPKFGKMQILTDNLNRIARENLTGIRVVRAYNAEGYQEEKFNYANEKLTVNQLSTNRGIGILMVTMPMIMNGLNLAIFWVGAYIINTATDKLPLFSNMVVFSSYAMQVIMSLTMMVTAFIILPRAVVSAKRINEVLDMNPVIKNGVETSGKHGITGEITYNNVSFKYPGATDYVLQNISFTVKRGETVAIIGSTGSGKSTLVNLLPRFYDISEGEILLDGIDVKQYEKEALHSKIGYVPQKAVLFKGTIASNIAYGGHTINSHEADVKSAADTAQSIEFIECMDGKYNADVSQGGINLSGGQRQRLSIARAIYWNPEVFIFDDSFSALDYKTDRTLRTQLKKSATGITNIIVAQRIGTIMDAEQIIVLDEGRIVGKGTHKSLLKTCEVYKQIAQSQLSEEELA